MYEGMVRAVLEARDKYLAKGGVLIPARVAIWAVPFTLPECALPCKRSELHLSPIIPAIRTVEELVNLRPPSSAPSTGEGSRKGRRAACKDHLANGRRDLKDHTGGGIWTT